MATNSAQLQETILKAIDAVVTQRNNDLKLDKTIIGIIKKNIGKRGTKPLYQIEYSGGIIEAVAQNDLDTYSPHTSVYVLVPQGNFSNEKIIIGRSSSIITDRSASVIAAAINNYSIVGANLLTSLTEENIKDRKFGLYSFHPSFRDTIEIDGISHRALFLYQKNNENNTIAFSDNRLNIYKDDATAIMIKADFLTNLDSIQKQQPNARYGLIFNFAFDNLNKGYGETNGEILTTVSKIVRGNILNENGEELETTLENIIANFEENFNNLDIGLNYWIDENTGIIDQTIENIQALYNCFKIDNAKLDKEIINITIQAFLSLLNELKYKNTISDITLRYNEWLEEVVGDDSQKYVQFVLSSDDMIGNPFSFNTWNTQYSVFDIDLETFNHLDSILFYKEGFFVDTEDPYTDYEHQWPIGTNGEPDIFVKNLQIYAMNPLDNQSGDYTLNIEPYLDSDIFISEENPSTRFKATLLRRSYEDLTTNNNTSFYWFKEDSSVINSDSKNYHYLGGSGWRKLNHNEINYLFTTTIQENFAYKNNYKCIAIYEPSIDDKTILSFTFSVYNENEKTDIKLESNLGTSFSFDAGIPIIKVLINEDRIASENYQEFGADSDYLYCWTIDDAANGYTLFLDEVTEVLKDELTASEAMLLSAKRSLLKKIKFFILDEPTDSPAQATRIKYPVSISSSGFTVKCYVKKKKENGFYYDVGSASLEFENKNETLAAGYRIHIVNGDQIFQYDEYGNTPCSEKKKNPLVIKPLQAKLFTPSGIEVEGTNYQVEWIFPIESTMIHTTETLRLNPVTDLVQSYIGSEINFYIDDLYDPDAYANQITCHIHFGDVDYYKDTNFYFGKQGNNGTNGTDIVAKIIYGKDDPTNILHYQPLTLYVQKRDNSEDTFGFLNIGKRSSQPTINFVSPNSEDSILKLQVYQKGNLISGDNYKPTYPRWNIAGNANERTNNTAKFFEITSSDTQQGTGLIWHYNYPEENNTNKYYYRMQNIKVVVQLLNEQTYYAFFSLPIIEYEPASLEANTLLPINRITIDKNYYLNEVIYNADGRNPIYNHNQGLKLINIPSNIDKIKWIAKGGLVEEENAPWISLLETKETKSSEKQTIITTIPENNTAMIYVLPNDIFNGSATNNRIEAELYSGESLIATVYAPINMTLNTFGLASLNAWDGNTVTIDNEGGYVMAPQIGAGEKDDNNRFTGILMGKTETYTGGGDLEEQTGLFGYANGLQSIFLDSKTGNSTFGLPDVYSELDENGNIVRKYQHTNRNSGDDYNEGRIELRPGGISKIGGWRLGRRSLYYIEGNKDIGPKYSNDYVPDKTGTIKSGTKYNKHHDKDIGEDDAGVLLHSGNYPYLSIKGKKLNLEEDNLSDSSLSYLMDGDSLEVQIDPYTPTLFTIFRHNGQARYNKVIPEGTEPTEDDILYPVGSRTYLAGINARGQLVANGLQNVTKPTDGAEGDTVTTFGVNAIPAFGEVFETATHIGLMMDAADQMISKIFVKNIQDKTSTMYLTGSGTQNNEYIRPISLNGKTIGLFASSDSSISPTTNYNIQISQDKGQIQVGDLTNLILQRQTTDTNTLNTAGSMQINIGTAVDGQNKIIKKDLSINAAATSIAINGSNITNAGNTIINNKGTTTVTGNNSIILQKQDSNGNTLGYIKFDKNDDDHNQVQLGIPIDGQKSLITLTNSTNSWNTIGTLNISSTNTGSAILIHADHPGSGTVHTGVSSPQLELRAGRMDGDKDRRVRLLLSSSDNTWANSKGTNSDIGGYYNVDGEPFRVQYGTQGISIKTNIMRTTQNGKTVDTQFYNFCTDMSIRAAGGIILTDGLSAPEKSGANGYSLWAVKGLHTELGGDNNADKILSFASTQFKGTQSNSYSITTTNLKAAIDYCLRAATSAWQASEDLKNSLGTAAYSDTDDFRSSSWSPDLSGYATKQALGDYIKTSDADNKYKISGFAVASGDNYEVSVGFNQGSTWISDSTTIRHSS